MSTRFSGGAGDGDHRPQAFPSSQIVYKHNHLGGLEMDTRTQDSLARDEVGNLISSDKVDGTAVYNRSGESVGSINHLMIDKLTGQVAYAVMSFGGFLGIGEKYHPLPWKVLDYDVAKGGYVIDCDKRALEKAPMYESNDATSWSERGWRKRVDEYYLPYM